MRSVIIVLMLSAAVSTAPAQGIFLAGPQLGFYKTRGVTDSRAMGGIALHIRISEGFAMVGSVNYREERFVDGHVNVKSWPVMASGLFYLNSLVFGTVGAGWYNAAFDYTIPLGYQGSPEIIATDYHQEFGWHFGGGIELPLGLGTKLVGDMKYVFLNYDFAHIPGSEKVNSNFYVMTVGLLFVL